MRITVVGATDLPDLLPLVRGYCALKLPICQ